MVWPITHEQVDMYDRIHQWMYFDKETQTCKLRPDAPPEIVEEKEKFDKIVDENMMFDY